MSKRAPTSTLTHDNWNDEYKQEEAGSFQRASNSTLKERVIMKARRKRAAENNGASAFAGIKFKPEKEKTSNNSTPEKPKDEPVTNRDNKENEEVEPDSVCQSGDGEVSNLNKALLKWIEKHINENAVCDLRPIFEDYRKHMERIDKKYNTSWSEVDEPETVEGVSPIKEETAKSEESPQKEEVKVDPPKLFSFEKKSSPKSSPPKFSFTPKSDDSNSSGKTEPPKFSFSASGSGTTTTAEKPAPMFSFKPKPADNDVAESEPKKTSFFSQLDSAPKPFTGFSFGGSSNGTGSGGFGFGAGSGTLGSTFKPMSESKPAEDDDYVPPKVEDAEFDDGKDALYQKKAKIFYSKEGNYKEIGVGQMFVKPLDDNKGSILVRADNTLGNILLNILIPNAPAPASVGKNNCLITAVPNPAIEGVEGPVPILIRVKTGEDRDELIELIKSKQTT